MMLVILSGQVLSQTPQSIASAVSLPLLLPADGLLVGLEGRGHGLRMMLIGVLVTHWISTVVIIHLVGLLMRVGLRVRDRLLMVLRNRHIGVAVCVVHVGRSWRSCINRVTGLRMEVGLVRGLHDWGLNLRLLLELLERLSLGLWASGRCASG